MSNGKPRARRRARLRKTVVPIFTNDYGPSTTPNRSWISFVSGQERRCLTAETNSVDAIDSVIAAISRDNTPDNLR
jgi:hypothetical protein